MRNNTIIIGMLCEKKIVLLNSQFLTVTGIVQTKLKMNSLFIQPHNLEIETLCLFFHII